MSAPAPPASRTATNGTDRPRRALAAHGVAALLLAAMAWSADGSAAHKSPTFDESAHVVAGFSFWHARDFRLNPESGVFPQLWAMWPAWLGGAHPPDLESDAWRLGNDWALARSFLYASGNAPDALLRGARRMILLLALGLGVLVYAWSFRLFGAVGGLLSLALFALCPNVLAHARLVTADMALAASFLAALAASSFAFRRVGPARLLLAAAAVGVLFLAKFGALLFGPMLVLLIGVRVFSPEAPLLAFGSPRPIEPRGPRLAVLVGASLLIAAGAWSVIWAAHGFAFRASLGEPPPLAWARVERMQGFLPGLILWARELRLLPETWLYGLGYTLETTQERVAFARGLDSTTGWWWFFPYAVAVKTPLGTLALWALAVAAGLAPWLARRGPPDRDAVWRALERTAPLWILVAVYWTASLASNINIGVRHLLPSYAAFMILSGAAARWTRSRAGLALVVALLASTAVASFSVRPHYLAFFNRSVGGPAQGYRHLVDSNLDWGQDLPGLARWLGAQRRAGDAAPCYLSYFGSVPAEPYGVDCVKLPGFFDDRPPRPVELEPGLYAVSATMLPTLHVRPAIRGRWTPEREALLARVAGALAEEQSRGERGFTQTRQAYEWLRFARLTAWLREREPDAQVGYSILVYRLDAADLEAALRGPLRELERS